jgi:hypothetical protein
MLLKHLCLLLISSIFFLCTTLKPNFTKFTLLEGPKQQKILLFGESHPFVGSSLSNNPSDNSNTEQYDDFVSFLDSIKNRHSIRLSVLVEGGCSIKAPKKYTFTKHDVPQFLLLAILAHGKSIAAQNKNICFYNVENRPDIYKKACSFLAPDRIINPFGNSPESIKNFQAPPAFDFSLNDLITELSFAIKRMTHHITETGTVNSNSSVYLQAIQAAGKLIIDLKKCAYQWSEMYREQPFLYTISLEWINSVQYHLQAYMAKNISNDHTLKQLHQTLETLKDTLKANQQYLQTGSTDNQTQQCYTEANSQFLTLINEIKTVHNKYFHQSSLLDFIDVHKIRRDLEQLIVASFAYLITLHTFHHIISIDDPYIMVMAGYQNTDQVIQMLIETKNYKRIKQIDIDDNNFSQMLEDTFPQGNSTSSSSSSSTN